MSPALLNLLSLVLVVGIVWGIRRMSSPRTAVGGNLLGAACVLGGVLLTLYGHGLLTQTLLWAAMAVGAAAGCVLAVKVAMIQMPQMVALLNGFGGAASLLASLVVFLSAPHAADAPTRLSGALALAVGGLTFSGSMVAAGKLARRIPQQPIRLPGHGSLSTGALALLAVLTLAITVAGAGALAVLTLAIVALSLAFGVIFAIRVGGADMPISISLLNSLSGVAGSLAGFVVRDPLLVAAGGIVGASGLILTHIMCRASNRTLPAVLTGRSTMRPAAQPSAAEPAPTPADAATPGPQFTRDRVGDVLRAARSVIIVPGYGMALAQAQQQVRRLADALEARGAEVRFAIHPVAGRMPGHMHVLLAEVEIPYERLCDMDAINDDFARTDVAIVVGANDVVNPAANTAVNTPIYGMPILKVNEARCVIVCNQDTQPGYSGVPNPLYESPNVILYLGDAARTVGELADALGTASPT